MWVCGCGREREKLKRGEREYVGVWVCGYEGKWGQGKRVCGCGSVWGKRGFKKVQTRLTALVQRAEKGHGKVGDREREYVGMWVWEGKRNAES